MPIINLLASPAFQRLCPTVLQYAGKRNTWNRRRERRTVIHFRRVGFQIKRDADGMVSGCEHHGTIRPTLKSSNEADTSIVQSVFFMPQGSSCVRRLRDNLTHQPASLRLSPISSAHTARVFGVRTSLRLLLSLLHPVLRQRAKY